MHKSFEPREPMATNNPNHVLFGIDWEEARKRIEEVDRLMNGGDSK